MKVRKADEGFMHRALILARRGIGLTSPNPCVGAVLVRNGKIIGEGWHRRVGTPHAEVHAVRQAKRRGGKVSGATLYVTLEPCCTHGRTPPCTDLIVQEKIQRVVVGATDPNPRHAGRAYRFLEQAGVKVTTNVLSRQAEDLNRAFNHWIVGRQPWVIGKMALSLDGRIAVRPGDDRWLTSRPARRYSHQLRGEADAILIGASTAREDNPSLTVRLPGFRRKIQPWRVVVSRSGDLPPDLQLFQDAYRDRTLVFRRKSLERVLVELGERGVTCVLIEGGGHVLGQALARGLVHEVAFFLAPVVLGSDHPGIITSLDGSGWRVTEPSYQRLGPDLLCRGRLTHD